MRAYAAYLFRHSVLRDAAYQLQLPHRRAHLHALALEILEESIGSAAERDALAFELAQHAHLAAQESEGFERLRLLGKEADWLARAAEFFAAKERNADAMEAFLRLGSHESLSPSERMRYKHRATRPMATLGRTSEVLALLDEIRQWAANHNAADQENAALTTLGEVLTRKGDAVRAESVLSRLVERAQSAGDRALLATAQNLLGTLFANTGRLDDAEKLLDKSIGYFESAGDTSKLAGILSNRAGVAMEKLQYAKARALYERALLSAKTHGHRVREGIVLGTLGWMAVEEGKLDEALSLALRARQIAQETGDRNGEGIQACTLAGVYARRGQFADSEQQFLKSLSILREVGNRRFEGTALRDFADLRDMQGLLEEAAHMMLDAIAIHREVRDRVGEGFAFGRLAHVQTKLGQKAESQASWQMMHKLLDQATDEPLRQSLEENMRKIMEAAPK